MQTYSLLLAPTYTVQLVPLDPSQDAKTCIPTRIREITQDSNEKYRDP